LHHAVIIIAELTAETERGMSRMLRSSPITSPTGRTVGRTCSPSGTSLTVYFSRVVTWSESVAAAGAVVVVVVVVVVDCARSPIARLPKMQPAAELVLISLAMVSFMWLRCLRLKGPLRPVDFWFYVGAGAENEG
jgi:hypothetical protein